MWKALVLCLLVAVSVAPAFAAENTYSVGGGLAGNNLSVDGGAEVEAGGGFGVFRALERSGSLFIVSVSYSEDDDTEQIDIGAGTVDVDIADRFLRLAISGGYMFRRDKTVRPFAHAGFAYIQAKEEIDGNEVIDDSSLGLSLGVGLEVGRGHHSFYTNLAYDIKQDLESQAVFNGSTLIGRSEFDLIELHLGYVYTF